MTDEKSEKETLDGGPFLIVDRRNLNEVFNNLFLQTNESYVYKKFWF